MLRENAVFKKMIATGEERMSKIAAQLLSNEKFMGALQKTVTAAMEAKGSMERAAQSALAAMNIPTSSDVKKLEGKIEERAKGFARPPARTGELGQQDAPPPTH